MGESRPIGSSGIKVRPIGLGGMALSLQRRPSENEGIRVILAALETGIDFIDTADVYCLDDNELGHNERIIARALQQWKGHPVVVATKCGCIRPEGRWDRNGRPEHIRQACEASLKALGLAQITLYQLHAPDPAVPFADSVGAMAELQRAGKIQHIGLSNVSVRQIEQATGIAPIVSVQNRCNIHDRSSWQHSVGQQGVVQYCEQHGIAFLAYSPVGGNRGKDTLGHDAKLQAVATRLSATPFQVALAWLLAKSPVMIPIPGASKMESAVSSGKAMDLVLSPQDLAELDAAFPV
jgi:aryl-alcohol dehydrogenase-like predicted oxidoreductase